MYAIHLIQRGSSSLLQAACVMPSCSGRVLAKLQAKKIADSIAQSPNNGHYAERLDTVRWTPPVCSLSTNEHEMVSYVSNAHQAFSMVSSFRTIENECDILLFFELSHRVRLFAYTKLQN